MELSEQARKLKNAYQRQWAAKNRERVKLIQMNYWERRAAEVSSPEIQARELQGQGLTQREIAKRLNLRVETVNAILNKP